MLDLLNDEADKLISDGVTGLGGIAFGEAGKGRAAGGDNAAGLNPVNPAQRRQAMAAAAARRAKNASIMHVGGRTLGGGLLWGRR